ncbi:MAG: aldolase [Alphaproteobacteria bacterium]|nr:aldolase [Alphaproteobacteria bacterium]
MTVIKKLSNSRQEELEWQCRVDLAAAFQLTYQFGWNRGIGNHYSLMVPNSDDTFFVNARGLLFSEITASNLIRCDFKGNVLEGKGEIRDVTYNIHVPIHRDHPSAKAVLHVHPPNITAISLLENGRVALAHHNNLIFNDRIAYDDEMTGPALDLDEGDRIARGLGDKTIMVMANHGVTVVGPTVHDSFSELSICEHTCGDQLRAMWTGLKLREQPAHLKWDHKGAFGDRIDAKLSFDAQVRQLERDVGTAYKT